ncbi:unnamed protein product [Microthlaspi erraticum]|uniref:RNase H type-1 domain-containing protein n=1 Tax=Microthlaspi erraticum TaxID=1685480 RepID=A0A6D2K2M1_9BRAS|nr:unnamed protein product [Microthlaspi erraticum]
MAQVVQSTVDSDDETETAPQGEDVRSCPECKTDASWDMKDNLVGLSFVLMNKDGSCLYGAKANVMTQTVTHAEFKAILWALRNATEIGYTSIHLQTDCQQVLKMIKEEEEWPAFADEIEDFTLLKHCFTCFDISYIPRTLNVCADSLAKGARSHGFV